MSPSGKSWELEPMATSGGWGEKAPGDHMVIYPESSFFCSVPLTVQICFFPIAVAAEVGPLCVCVVCVGGNHLRTHSELVVKGSSQNHRLWFGSGFSLVGTESETMPSRSVSGDLYAVRGLRVHPELLPVSTVSDPGGRITSQPPQQQAWLASMVLRSQQNSLPCL